MVRGLRRQSWPPLAQGDSLRRRAAPPSAFSRAGAELMPYLKQDNRLFPSPMCRAANVVLHFPSAGFRLFQYAGPPGTPSLRRLPRSGMTPPSGQAAAAPQPRPPFRRTAAAASLSPVPPLVLLTSSTLFSLPRLPLSPPAASPSTFSPPPTSSPPLPAPAFLTFPFFSPSRACPPPCPASPPPLPALLSSAFSVPPAVASPAASFPRPVVPSPPRLHPRRLFLCPFSFSFRHAARTKGLAPSADSV